ncbi:MULTISPECIES: TetR/AcrR family transcriptional regulator [Prauserella]|uniref:TetR/AcrR family transcriptional regulator n=1 Tax=Prauserella TaxID=142577 RepID=UPI000D83979A|nr:MULTISPECIES: TetR/AcrR family transcriptional regulator [Prauserella]PXY33255.1 hypothetical protein BAY59_09115 [Prauserella coralliicola]
MQVEPGWAGRIARHATVRPDAGSYVGPRTKLVTAGQQLLLERGDTTYTIDELVRRAHVAIKTFYRCFANKEEFLKEVFMTSVAGATPRIREQILSSADDPLARLRLAVTWPLEWRRENGTVSRVIAKEHMRLAVTSPETIAETSRSYEALLKEFVLAAQEEGQIRPADVDWDVHIITSVVTTSFHTMILGPGEPGHHGALAENVWRFCLTALHGDPG